MELFLALSCDINCMHMVVCEFSTRKMMKNFFMYIVDEGEEVSDRGMGRGGNSFDKLTYSINIDGVSRCPLYGCV